MKKPLKKSARATKTARAVPRKGYPTLVNGIGELLDTARFAAVRVTNALMTATYWEVGRRIVEFEQRGKKRAEYGDELLKRLAVDLTARMGRGFSRPNLQNMRLFYQSFPREWICQTLSGKSRAAIREVVFDGAAEKICQTVSGKSRTAPVIRGTLPPIFTMEELAAALPLPWSHYVLLIQNARSVEAIDFYHTEALRGGWSVRQLARQMDSLFYERTALSRNKVAMLKKGAQPRTGDALTVDEAVRDPLVLEFLNLRDEYSEADLEDALIHHLETFLLELGGDFSFVGRQRRLRIDDEWYRVDLLFFHRRLRCLIIIDLKLGKFTHADAGQMHLYLNYAREHWTHPDENPPVGLILCSSAGQNLVRYALENMPGKILARAYRLALPEEKQLARELEKARRKLEPKRRLR